MNSPSPHRPISGLGLALLALVAGCRHDHQHDHASSRDHADSPGELAAQSVTVWTDETELFMEYEPLVVGSPSRLAAHLTTLASFKAVTSGALTLTLTLEDGLVLETRADQPASPGIFSFTLTPLSPGRGTMTLSYRGQGITDTIDGGACMVFANPGAARAALPKGSATGIAFTKEQQWKTDFATTSARSQSLQPSVRAVGEVRPVSGREVRLTAPARGRITLATPTPSPGMAVKKRQLLATLSPYLAAGGDRSTLEAQAQSAEAEHAAARSQLVRVERLYGEQAVSERRLEDARARERVLQAKLDAATGRLHQYREGAGGMGGRGSGAFQLRSAIDGTLVEVSTTTGDSAEQGQLLFVVIDLSRLWLVAKVFEPDIPKVESAAAAWFTLEGYEHPFVIDAMKGSLVTVGRVIDPKSRTVPVIFEMTNPDGRIRIGQFAEVFIATGELRTALALPSSALLDDAGKRIVFVQEEGERFTRRVLRTGIKAKGWVEVLDGVAPGERIVTRGAYEVRLASASGAIPDHGHVH